MIELFDIPESKSPRLVWMEKHGVKTSYCNDLWQAEHGITIAFGDSELDALTELAKKLNLKLWNEEKP